MRPSAPSAAAETEGEPHASVRPTDAISFRPSDDLAVSAHILPTDSLGRELRPVVLFNGSALRSDGDGNYFDQMGRIVERDEEQRALGPDGRVLKVDADGNWVYPPLDK